jgi:predicted ATPase/DNA-binding SARP family transcriptional activator
MVLTNIPRGLNRLIGRDADVSALVALLRDSRLVTLTGAGGSGKTRLASEVAAVSADAFPDGIVWIELAPLAESELLPAHVLDTLGLEHGARPPLDTLLDALRERHMLLVLDNCEHLVEACAGLAARLLHECPRLRILATSREALGIDGERAWLVPGLTIPDTGEQPVEVLEDVPAVRLFVERAQASQSAFRLTSANAGAVIQICRRLDGLPLALELAAARIRTLPPHELAGRLDNAFRVLSAGPRTAIPRHRTLRAAIEWSYALLSERERVLLQRLSIFAGDFTLNAAESVGSDVDLDAADVLDVLAALVDKSLVVVREDAGTARFQLLETIRQYATSRLRESGHFHRVCTRHAKTYLDLAAEAAPHLITRDRPQWVQRLHRELDNIRVALSCTRDDDVAAHLRFLGNLGWFWYSSGHWSEGRRWLEGAIALPAPEAARHDRARVLLGAGVLASLQGHTTDAVPWVEESAALFKSLGDESGEAYALAYQGVAWGLIADERSEPPTRRALAVFRESGDLYGLRLCLVVLATYCSMKGRVDEARTLGEEAVVVAREYGLDRELAIALQVLAGVRLATGDVASAEALYRECVAALRRDPSLFWTARALHMMALVAFRQQQSERGAFLMGASEVVRETVGARFFGYDRAQLEPAMAAARQTIGDAAFQSSWNSGRAMPLAELMEELARPVTPTQPPTTRPTASPVETSVLEVRALGPLEILRNGAVLPDSAWRYARPRELLLFLLSHPEGRTRDQIGLVFWPDASTTQVKNNFHVMLHHVRKALGRADLVTFERDHYRINWDVEGGVRFDARSFEETAKAALRALKTQKTPETLDEAAFRLRDAMSLYRGDFLVDAEAGDWHLDIRDRLRRLALDGRIALGDLALARGAWSDAAESFAQAIHVDELNETAFRRFLTALARSGDRSEALRQYERLVATLRSTLGVEPDPETRVLYQRLRKAEPV